MFLQCEILGNSRKRGDGGGVVVALLDDMTNHAHEGLLKIAGRVTGIREDVLRAHAKGGGDG